MSATYERYPQESLRFMFENQIKKIWPELAQYEDNIYPIYAGKVFEYSFEHRPFDDLVSEVSDALSNKDFKFLFMCEGEDIVLESIEIIHNLIDELSPRLKHENVIYLSGASNLDKVYDIFCKRQKYTQKINLMSGRYFECMFQQSTKAQRHLTERTEYEPLIKEKIFLCFNKVHRKHRIMLLDKFYEHNLLDKAYYSFQGENSEPNWIDNIDCKYEHFLKNADKLPLVLNINPNRTNPVDIIPDDFAYFDNSVFSIVTETTFFKNHYLEPSIFFSEKIWKPIVMQHPFILVSRPGMLAQLRKYGYKTFHPYIDESYDTIIDDSKRFDAVFNEILRLSKLNDDELLEIQRQLASTVKFNRRHFLNNTDFRHTKDISKIFQ